MLYRAPVQAVKLGRVSRRYGKVVVVMRHYPRFLPKEKVDEYCKGLAPELSFSARLPPCCGLPTPNSKRA